MRILALAPLVLLICGSASAQRSLHVAGLPAAGTYDVLWSVHGRERRVAREVDATNPADFEKQFAPAPEARCRDREVVIRKGTFRIAHTCDHPHTPNVRTVLTGSFSERTIELVAVTTSGEFMDTTTQSYRLRDQR